METYILKYPVYNSDDFPEGTIVTITDDYWGNNRNDKNTGFTVVDGDLKGKKGCVADGLQGYLIANTTRNRASFREIAKAKLQLEKQMGKLKKRWAEIKPVTLPSPPSK